MESLKEDGNKFFNEKEYSKALECYMESLDKCNNELSNLKELDKLNEDGGNDTEDEEETNDEQNVKDNSYSKDLDKLNDYKAILNSNIAATLCNLNEYGKALEYGVECTKLKPNWYKSWYRLTIVLNKLKKYDQALTTIDKAIECTKDENTELPSALVDLKDEIESKLKRSKKNENTSNNTEGMSLPPGLTGLGEGMNPFIGELMKNEELKSKMNDPAFKEKMMKNKNNPMALLGDPEVMNLVGKLANNLNMGK